MYYNAIFNYVKGVYMKGIEKFIEVQNRINFIRPVGTVNKGYI